MVTTVCADLEMLGNGSAWLKAHDGPAVLALQREIVACVPGFGAETSSVAQSATNAMVENAIRRMPDMAR